jgi:hypothetical protein
MYELSKIENTVDHGLHLEREKKERERAAAFVFSVSRTYAGQC